ncbi:50S ribosomal protein L2 [Candidatus Kaiserbacteria bacterium RIFCSPLOWO2_02_FULL_55_12]|uniref:Large ribosomal subunit protein uL2 n=2 Tax=Candidatus Kaiseribacteriota TaxID=1752734 RepID=A0A1F6F066_9BACT|nr:MAG: 50S ribosomal protein L2 [Parcubacteria group bacterium GW2011_GWA2_56_21]OGG64143.1 MAG: 50S ribosomal protein L2 [Candidatus Kaiserbacteria bacterium RIFCSPHIGHO2_02_FULL_55_17]OGG79258.1 MAG: 50S ribosomal protein L2 [Candidatus Kaiserbacteria bacterium RIFCSPLOWO2_02_FULL_55_12]
MKTYKPTSKSRRHMTTLPYKELLSGDAPHKPLLKKKSNQGGRNAFGRITTRHQGGGHKKRFREVDFLYNKRNIPAKIETVEYDPFRSAFIGLALYKDGTRRYVILPKEMKVGSSFIVSDDAPPVQGNRLPLGKIPVGTFVYNIELSPGAGATLVRSAGNFAEVVAHDAGYAQVKLPSTEIRKVSDLCWASVGAVGNEEYNLVVIGKAGRSRWLGIRPTVRGSAMNPVDHPHGGGEGRQGRGLRRAKTAWGKPSGKGQKTRTPKKYSNVFIVSRRKVGKKRKA